MARKGSSSNGGRVTAREVLTAVEAVYGRVDDVYGRVEGAHERIDEIVREQGKVTVALVELRACVNDELHKVRSDIRLLKRPWKLVGGWAGRAFSAGLGAAGVATWVFLIGRWPF